MSKKLVYNKKIAVGKSDDWTRFMSGGTSQGGRARGAITSTPTRDEDTWNKIYELDKFNQGSIFSPKVDTSSRPRLSDTSDEFTAWINQIPTTDAPTGKVVKEVIVKDDGPGDDIQDGSQDDSGDGTQDDAELEPKLESKPGQTWTETGQVNWSGLPVVSELSSAPASAGFLKAWVSQVEGTEPPRNVLPTNVAEARIVKEWTMSNRSSVTWDGNTHQMMSQGQEITVGQTEITADMANILGLAPTPDVYDLSGVDKFGKITSAQYDQLQQTLQARSEANAYADSIIAHSMQQDKDSFARAENAGYAVSLNNIRNSQAIAAAELKRTYDLELAKINVEAGGLEERKTALTMGQQTRANLDFEYNLRSAENEDTHQRLLERIEEEHRNLSDQVQQKIDAEIDLEDLRYEYEYDVMIAQKEFDAEQDRLDRAIAIGNLQEVSIHNRNLELLKNQENKLKENELKVALVSKISDNPAFLYYAKKSGMLEMLASALGGTKQTNDMYTALTSFIPEDDMKFGNIQTMNKKSVLETAINRFAQSVNTGLTTLQQGQRAIQEAPRGIREQRYQRPELRAGRATPKGLYDFSSEKELEEAVGGRYEIGIPGDPAPAGVVTTPLQPRAWETDEGMGTWREQMMEGKDWVGPTGQASRLSVAAQPTPEQPASTKSRVTIGTTKRGGSNPVSNAIYDVEDALGAAGLTSKEVIAQSGELLNQALGLARQIDGLDQGTPATIAREYRRLATQAIANLGVK